MEDVKKLRSPTTRHCQAYHGNAPYYHFSDPPLQKDQRCDRIPTTTVTQNIPGVDGRRGSMALCDRCLKITQLLLPEGYLMVASISAEQQLNAESRKDRISRGLTKRQARDQLQRQSGGTPKIRETSARQPPYSTEKDPHNLH